MSADAQLPGLPAMAEIHGMLDNEAEPVPPGFDIAPFSLEPDKPKRAPHQPDKKRWPLFVIIGCLLTPCLCCLLLFCGTVAAGVTVGAILENAGVTATGTESIAVEPGEALTVTIDNHVGDVTIEPGAADEVRVDYVKKAYGLTTKSARRELDDIAVVVTRPAPGHVVIAVDLNKGEDSFFSVANNVRLTIRVPDEVSLDIQTKVSDITIANVRVTGLNVENSTGEITFSGEFSGSSEASYRLQTHVGDIQVRLPRDAVAGIDAAANVGEITVAGSFSIFNRVTDEDGPGQTWRGTIGSADEAIPTLTLKTDVGDIDIAPR